VPLGQWYWVATYLSPLSHATHETRQTINYYVKHKKTKKLRTVTVDIDEAKRRWTACPPVARLAPSPPFAARFKNLKRTEAEAGPARGLPPLAGERQRADRPDFCSATIYGFFIAGCTVDPNHHCSAKSSGQQATGAVPDRLPGGSARPAASLDSRLAFIIFRQCARIDNDGSQVQIIDSPAEFNILMGGIVIAVYENIRLR
jgi:hypothetical protein